MKCSGNICFALIVLSSVIICNGQNYWKHNKDETDKRKPIIWCTISRAEQRKCIEMAKAVDRDRLRVGYDDYKLDCKHAFNKDECMVLLDEEKVTLTTLDAGEVFVGGRFHSLVPIAQEISEGGFNYHYAVAVMKRNTNHDVASLRDLRGKRGCFAGVGTLAGWVVPVYTLMREGGMEVIDCNNHVKSTTHFFGPSCAVNALSDKYNPIGDNSDKLCQLCIGRVPGGKCTHADPYAGFEGAFRCLLEVGDVAFLKHNTVEELTRQGMEFDSVGKDTFELLCKDGSRRPIDDFRSCHWGTVPTNALVTSSASTYEDRVQYQRVLDRLTAMYAKPGNGSSGNFDRTFDNERNRNLDNRNEYDVNGNRLRVNRRRRRQQGGGGQQGGNYGSGGRDRGSEDYDRNRLSGGNFNPDSFNRDPNPDNFPRSPDYDRDRNLNLNNPFTNRNNSPFERDPFSRDPFTINRDQYGLNIDPYDTNVNNYNRDGNRDGGGGRYNDSYYDDFRRNRNNGSFYEMFDMFESTPRYGVQPNLMFLDTTRKFSALSESQQTYAGYLGKSLDLILGVRDCPVNSMTLCVTSDVELEKCIKMRTALKAQLLKPEMVCYKGHSQIHCMQAIRSGTADVTVLDSSDVYTAGLNFELIPFVSEVYNLGDPEYYVVAVSKEADPDTELTYLKGKNTCHGGVNTAAGWVYPLAYLMSNGWIRPYGCNSIRAAAEYFTKSCVPGALSSEYNTGVPYDNMCDLCHGASYRYCRRDASEDYYGHTGAFRCLVEGGGHVAFVKHTTVSENTGGKRREWWARDALVDDFELLCPDGTRAEVNDYKKCNLGKVKANAVVTRGGYGYNETQLNAYINLFLYSQTFYGKKIPDEFSFSMFYSTPPYTDLIFQDATTQLKVIPTNERYYSTYVGKDFMRARRIVDCHAGAALYSFSLTLLVTLTAVNAVL